MKTKIIVNGKREGWACFDENYPLFTGKFVRTEDAPAAMTRADVFYLWHDRLPQNRHAQL